MEDETVAPGDHRARERPVREAVACDEQRRAPGEEPEVHEVEDRHVVTQVEQEIMPCALLVLVEAQWKQVKPDDSICYMYPPVAVASAKHQKGRMARHILRGHAEHERGEEQRHDAEEK